MSKNKVVVDRKKWYRGQEDNYSALVVDDSNNDEDIGKRCCLGFACNQLEGIPYNQLKGLRMPYNIDFKNLKHPLFNSGQKSMELLKIAEINDEKDVSDESRESKLKNLFSEFGVELEFKN